jgi:hypothetical protein
MNPAASGNFKAQRQPTITNDMRQYAADAEFLPPGFEPGPFFLERLIHRMNKRPRFSGSLTALSKTIATRSCPEFGPSNQKSRAQVKPHPAREPPAAEELRSAGFRRGVGVPVISLERPVFAVWLFLHF